MLRVVSKSGGGKGVLCGKDNLKLLDLYEAEQKLLPIPKASGNTSIEVEKYGPKIIEYFSTSKSLPFGNKFWWMRNLRSFAKMERLTDKLSKNENDIFDINLDYYFKTASNLPITDDATIPELEPGCRIVQIAVNQFINDQTDTIQITYDPYYWNMLDSINKFALAIHEFFYSRERQTYDYSIRQTLINKLKSDETRKVIALLLSQAYDYSLVGPAVKADYSASCTFGGGNMHGGNEEHFEIYINEEYQSQIKGVGLYFYGFKGILTVSRTYAFLPNLNIAQMTIKEPRELNSKRPTFTKQIITVKNDLMNKNWEMEIGTDEHGILMRVYEANQPIADRPNFSGGSCSIEN